MARITALIGAAVLLAASSASARELSIRGGFSGNWSDPIKSRQGIQIEVVDARRAVVAWFTYDRFGEPTWLFGVGDITGSMIEVEMLRFSNGTFPPTSADPDAVITEVWGNVVISFDDCDSGQMSWDPALAGFEPGSMEIGRISAIDGLRCGQGEVFEHEFAFNLDAGPGQWQALFADYRPVQLESIDPQAGLTTLPSPLGDREGFEMSGTNRSDDLAMFLTAPLGGLAPETRYRVELDMTFATNVPRNCFGIGGAPGEAVFVKLGAAGEAPGVDSVDDFFRFNFDHGIQSTSGADAIVVGDMTNSADCNAVGDDWRWELKTVSTRGQRFFATSDEAGRLWILAGSDSGFEGRTTFYLTRLSARMSRAMD